METIRPGDGMPVAGVPPGPRDARRRAKAIKIWAVAAAVVVTLGVVVVLAARGLPAQVLSGGRYGFSGPAAIAVDGTHVWVINSYDGTGGSVTELNASNGSWVRTLCDGRYGFNGPDAIAVDGSVTELDASDGSWVRMVSGARYGFDGPDAIAADGPRVWVANSYVDSNDASVTELNATDGRWVQTLSGGLALWSLLDGSWIRNGRYRFGNPDAIAVDGTRIWIVNGDGGAHGDGSVTVPTAG